MDKGYDYCQFGEDYFADNPFDMDGNTVEEIWFGIDQDGPPSLRQLGFTEIFKWQQPEFENITQLVLQSSINSLCIVEILAALEPRGEYILWPKLQTLEIHGVHASVWDSLKRLLHARAKSEHPLRTVCIYLADEQTSDGRELEIFDAWRISHDAEMQPLSVQVEFFRVARYPKMRLPSVCAPDPHYQWIWQDWTLLGDIASDDGLAKK